MHMWRWFRQRCGNERVCGTESGNHPMISADDVPIWATLMTIVQATDVERPHGPLLNVRTNEVALGSTLPQALGAVHHLLHIVCPDLLSVDLSTAVGPRSSVGLNHISKYARRLVKTFRVQTRAKKGHRRRVEGHRAKAVTRCATSQCDHWTALSLVRRVVVRGMSAPQTQMRQERSLWVLSSSRLREYLSFRYDRLNAFNALANNRHRCSSRRTRNTVRLQFLYPPPLSVGLDSFSQTLISCMIRYTA